MSEPDARPEEASILNLGADWYRIEMPASDGIPCHIEAPSLESAQRVARLPITEWERDKARRERDELLTLLSDMPNPHKDPMRAYYNRVRAEIGEGGER